VFLTFEGADGSGKTTQAARTAAWLEELGHTVVRLREPGGTPLSEAVRGLLLNPAHANMCPMAELLLFEAARAQLVSQVIVPALEAGSWVVCDRFVDSTVAYQAAGHGVDAAVVARANELGSQGVLPAVTVLLDIDPEVAATRMAARNAEKRREGAGAATDAAADRLELEGLDLQRRVAAGYRAIAAASEAAGDGRVIMVDAAGTEDEVFAQVQAALTQALGAALTPAGRATQAGLSALNATSNGKEAAHE
jgi:dTMP kinase